MNEFLSLLETLCALPGPSGNEHPVREALEALAKPYANEIRRLPLGGLLVFKKGAASGKTLLYDAHMDEVGFMVTGIRPDGLLRFAPVGGVDPRVTMSKRVVVNGHPGVVGGKPLNALEGDDRNAPGGIDTLYIDLGCDTREQAEALVSLGDTVTFDSEFVRFGDGFIKAKALDDRAGCSLLLQLLKRDLPYDAWFNFGTHEEIGGAGAKTAAFAVQPDYAVVVEATTAADVGGVAPDRQVCRARQGAVISFMDHGTIYPPALYHAAMKLAARKGIRAQTKEGVFGGNDAGSIHPTAGGAQCLTVSLPCRYIHSGASVLHTEDLTASAELLFALDELLGAGL